MVIQMEKKSQARWLSLANFVQGFISLLWLAPWHLIFIKLCSYPPALFAYHLEIDRNEIKNHILLGCGADLFSFLWICQICVCEEARKWILWRLNGVSIRLPGVIEDSLLRAQQYKHFNFFVVEFSVTVGSSPRSHKSTKYKCTCWQMECKQMVCNGYTMGEMYREALIGHYKW